jgi:hypothetical protein
LSRACHAEVKRRRERRRKEREANGDNLQPFILFTFVGAVFLSVTRTVARRPSFGTGICTATWGIWGVTIGVLDFAHGLGHPLLQDHTQEVVLTIFTVPCVLTVALIRKPNKT